MAVKRRTLWFTDEDWSKMQAVASARRVNVSQLLRELIRHEHMLDERDGSLLTEAERDARRAARRKPATTQADRDAILRKVNRHAG